MIRVYWINVRWDGVPGAERYEIAVDGVPVSTAGPNARTTRLSVQNATLVEISDLPLRSVVQAVEFSQQVVS
jgi:hypothetical protein